MPFKSTQVVLISLLFILTQCECCGGARGPLVPSPADLVITNQSRTEDGPPVEKPVPNCTTNPLPYTPRFETQVENSVSWEVEGKMGGGLKISEGIVPGGVDLSVGLAGKYLAEGKTVFVQGATYYYTIDPGLIMYFTTVRRKTWQDGYFDVKISGNRSQKIQVSYLIDDSYLILGTRTTPCTITDTSSAKPAVRATATLTNTPTNTPAARPTSTPTIIVQPVCMKGVIDFWTFPPASGWDSDRANEFAKMCPDAQVKIMSASPQDLSVKLVVASQAADLPDAARIPRTDDVQLFAKDRLIDADSATTIIRQIGEGKFDQKLLETLRDPNNKNRWLAVPSGRGTLVIMVRAQNRSVAEAWVKFLAQRELTP